MDGLKQSLEEAIKEMQDIPAASQPSARHDPGLRLARAADTLQTMHPAQKPAPAQRPDQAVQSVPEFIPASNSIEAALSSAPAVSPHYVPPQPVAAPVTAPVATMTSSVVKTPVKLAPAKRAPKRRALRFGAPKVMTSGRANAVTKIASVFSNRQSPMQNGSPNMEKAGSGVPDLGDMGDVAADLAKNAKKLRDNIWRWATISISCAGGLASGWLGSNISDQPGGIFQSSVLSIVGKASDNASAMKPANIKIVPQGGAKFMSGTAISGLPANITGKTDRAVPLDDDLCTVLELDRGTGLTLARPCKMIETAEFNTTLGKADLLATPK